MKSKLRTIGLAAGAIMLATAANASAMPNQMDNSRGLTSEEKAAGVFTPQVMWKMGRIGSVVISPDGNAIVYTQTDYDMTSNSGKTTLWIGSPTGGEYRRLTAETSNASDPAWSADGKAIYFMSDSDGTGQVWKIAPDGSGLTKVSSVSGGLDGFGITADGNRAFYVKRVHVENRESSKVYPDMPKSNALIYDDLMARHWNYWDKGEYMHIFVSPLQEGTFTDGRDIMEGEPWDAPMAPYFDVDEIAWSNNGKMLAYTCKKMTGREYAVSTDSDIYIYDVESGQTRNVTTGNVGYDKYPVFSPDDSAIAYLSMERPGNEADKDRLFVLDLASGQQEYITADFDYNAQNVVWLNDATLGFIAPIEGTHQICIYGLFTDGVEVFTSGDHDINAFAFAGDNMVASVTKLSMATELFAVNLEDGGLSQITFVNKEIYDNVRLGQVQKRWVTTTDDKQMLVWVVLPPDFDPNKKYPTLLYCQGGPQSVVSQFWSYRWNLELMASQGYIVVAPNRRGLPSFGQEWLDQISGDYSGQNIRDYLSAIDDVAREPWSDENRLGCVGASYGGYSVFFLAGNHQGRFKGFIAHCGIFDFDSMYGSTEELFFVNNDYGGPYWSDSPVAKRSYANSPHKFVQNWDTPILIITGLRDFRIPYTQSLEAFTAARVRGIPARLVAFEDEAHQVFKPQNSMVWNREFFGWLDKYVKNAE